MEAHACAGRLKGKVAIVTGAGSGIGRAAAILFAEQGASVVVADIQADRAASVAREISDERGHAITVDVASEDSVSAMVSEAAQRFGGIDLLYNNAGVNSSGAVSEATLEDWERCFAVNVTGTFLCSRAVVPHLKPRGGGAIVNQGSVAALVGVKRFAAYCAAKGAIVALTRSMAVDLAPQRIRVNCICPGTVYTPLMEPMLRERGGGDVKRGLELTVEKYPVGRLGDPQDIAAAALFLLSDEASFVTGSIYPVDGGMTAQ
ncbi:MAG: glucose 1-dehydrogenase [Actinomycetota bacterium]|nr:glucose 1-dehydrogenase [Actinomycetota bacterium]